MIVIGIDPGLDGALAIISCRTPHEVLVVEDLPVVAYKIGKKSRRRLAAPRLVSLLNSYTVLDEVACVMIEDQKAIGGEGRSSLGRLMEVYGIIQGCLAGVGLGFERVQPSVWKRKAGLLGKDKEGSRLLAIELYPAMADDLARKKDHGRAEAILIARYSLSTLTT